ncbi:MAG TPA: hypothetical protein VFV63_06700 [Ilumatobacteraceae bacterium]|nr:hypothetical protein [Ilumatobacteraceae bacterium]
MGDWETSEQLSEATTRPRASSSTGWDSGNWWWHRHFHVPVAVWILASVLGGAAIGNAVEPDRKATQTPTTIEVTSEPVEAAACDTDSGVDLDAEANRPSFAAGSPDAVSDPVGITCD